MCDGLTAEWLRMSGMPLHTRFSDSGYARRSDRSVRQRVRRSVWMCVCVCMFVGCGYTILIRDKHARVRMHKQADDAKSIGAVLLGRFAHRHVSHIHVPGARR